MARVRKHLWFEQSSKEADHSQDFFFASYCSMENPEELEVASASSHSNINCLPAVGIAEESREVAQ